VGGRRNKRSGDKCPPVSPVGELRSWEIFMFKYNHIFHILYSLITKWRTISSAKSDIYEGPILQPIGQKAPSNLPMTTSIQNLTYCHGNSQITQVYEILQTTKHIVCHIHKCVKQSHLLSAIKITKPYRQTQVRSYRLSVQPSEMWFFY